MATLNNICNKNPVFPNKNGHTFWIIRSYFQASKVILSHTFQQLKFIRNPVTTRSSGGVSPASKANKSNHNLQTINNAINDMNLTLTTLSEVEYC